MILDALMFLNENEMFEKRMKYLDFVDKFIVVEANYTHSHNKKDYLFEFADHPKVEYHKIDLSSDEDFTFTGTGCNLFSPAWRSENKHRNALMVPLKKYPEDTLVLFSDIDEIPNKHLLLEILKTYNGEDLLRFELEAYQFNFNNYTGKHPGTGLWINENIQRFTLQNCRWERDNCIPNGGWHLSYWGDAQKALYKLKSFAHQEWSIVQNEEYIQYCMDNNKDLFTRETELIPLEIPEEILRIFG